jgi:hypothetical protein
MEVKVYIRAKISLLTSSRVLNQVIFFPRIRANPCASVAFNCALRRILDRLEGPR